MGTAGASSPRRTCRCPSLPVVPAVVRRDEPPHILVDSVGLKIYGEGEWLQQKHGVRLRRRWRKLHLAIDADTREIVASALTTEDVGDASVVPDPLTRSRAQSRR